MSDKVSVIIPVHNGSKYIRKTIDNILSQTYENLELILVENFSSDNSLEICRDFEKADARVKVLQSFEKGTSLARKKGIEFATGKYIVFSDQDDKYKSNKAIERMHKAISKENVQIVQFGFCRKHKWGLIRNKSSVKQKVVLDRKEIIGETGLLFDHIGRFTVTVWDKIFLASVLKDVAKDINESLFYAEDFNLVIRTFLHKSVENVCVLPDCHYVWKTGIGFSASDNSGFALCDDYEKIKIGIVDLARKSGVDEGWVFRLQTETIFMSKSIIQSMIADGKEKEEVLKAIQKIESYNFGKETKAYFNSDIARSIAQWDELDFLSSNYTPDEYYDFMIKDMKEKTFKDKIKSFLQKL